MLGTGAALTGCPRGAGSLSREQQAGDQRPRFQVRKLGWSGRPVSEGVSAEIRMQASRQRSHSLCQGLEAGTGEACRGPAGGHALGLVGGGQVPQTSQPCQGRGLVLGGRTNTCGGQKEKPVPHGRLPTGQAPVADLTPPLSSGFMAEFLHLRRELQGSSLVVTWLEPRANALLLPRGCWQPRPSVRAVDGVRGVDSLPWPPDLMGLSPQGEAGVWGSQVG